LCFGFDSSVAECYAKITPSRTRTRLKKSVRIKIKPNWFAETNWFILGSALHSIPHSHSHHHPIAAPQTNNTSTISALVTITLFIYDK